MESSDFLTKFAQATPFAKGVAGVEGDSGLALPALLFVRQSLRSWTNREDSNKFSPPSICHPNKPRQQAGFIGMDAGVEGLEPSLTVLETVVLAFGRHPRTFTILYFYFGFASVLTFVC